MASQKLRRPHPLVVVLHGGLSGCAIGIAQGTFPIAHDQQTLYPFTVHPRFHLLEIGFILRLLLEETVDIFYGVYAKFLSGDGGEIEMFNITCKECFVERPFSQRNGKRRF